jgi:hypothetical protein
MTRMTMETIFALCVVGAVVCTQPAPAPVSLSTTEGPAPAPAAATTVPATTTAAAGTLYTHTINFAVTLSNISSITSQAHLIASLASGVAATSGGNVTVEIQHIKISSTYGGLPSGFSCNLVITAYANMTSLSTAVVTCNGNSYQSGGRRLEADNLPAEEAKQVGLRGHARRLTESAAMVATIANTDDNDVVVAMKNVIGNTSTAGFQSALNAAGVNVSSLTNTQAPTAQVSVTTTVTGSATQNISTADLQSNVASSVPGGANVTGVSVTTTSEATSGAGGESGARAIAAPMMTIFAAVMTIWAGVSFA